MKTLLSLAILSALLLLLTGCPYGHRFDEGRFPSQPVNLWAINSEYDDYNSTSPVIESRRYLYFSSNRNSFGGEFDIVGDHFRVLWDKEQGKLVVDNEPYGWVQFDYTDSLLRMINTGSDEFGPYSLAYYGYFTNEYYYYDLVTYSSDSSGNHDLKYAWFRSFDEMNPEEGVFGGPVPIRFLNTENDDAYLSFYGPGFFLSDYYSSDPGTITELFFCSDRDGDFNIYQAPVPQNIDLGEYLGLDTTVTITPVSTLNGDSQDKCPFVNGELLVFASDRPGGYGGFDLYYSRRQGSGWSDPVNFGDRINTEYDEYRPIALLYWEFINDLMIFSSDRPGGKGGFDLYYVGIPKMIQQ